MPGVRAVYHRQNLSQLFRVVRGKDFTGHIDEERPPFEDDIIRYYGQYVALVVADTYEQARAAAEAVKVTYAAQAPNVAPKLATDQKPEVQSERGDPGSTFDAAALKVDQTYTTPIETHNANRASRFAGGVGWEVVHAVRNDAGGRQFSVGDDADARCPEGKPASHLQVF